jgi:cobalt/nickel transport system ATP-binding protein
MDGCVFAADRVGFEYQAGVPVFDGISFEIRIGECVTVVGANGAGKTTLLKLLAGELFATTGRLRALGREMSPSAVEDRVFWGQFSRDVAALFYDPDMAVYCHSVLDEIVCEPAYAGESTTPSVRRAEEVMEMLSIGSLRDRPVNLVSEGEQQRVRIAALLARDPQVVILDAPRTPLDLRTSRVLAESLQDLKARGKSVVLSTSDPLAVETITDRVMLLDQRHALIAVGVPRAVLTELDLLERAGVIHEHGHTHGAGRHRHVHAHRGTTHDAEGGYEHDRDSLRAVIEARFPVCDA